VGEEPRGKGGAALVGSETAGPFVRALVLQRRGPQQLEQRAPGRVARGIVHGRSRRAANQWCDQLEIGGNGARVGARQTAADREAEVSVAVRFLRHGDLDRLPPRRIAADRSAPPTAGGTSEPVIELEIAV